jgi:hypothetical protein
MMRIFNRPLKRSFKRSFRHTLLFFTLLVSISACVVVPKHVTYQDADCHATKHRLELTIADINFFNGGCSGNCGDWLGFMIITGAASSVVSGSIAVIGNTLFWLEELDDCPIYDATHDNTHSH